MTLQQWAAKYGYAELDIKAELVSVGFDLHSTQERDACWEYQHLEDYTLVANRESCLTLKRLSYAE